jgi:Holliday junction resolvase
VSASKRKGTSFESAVVGYLQTHGFPAAERRALAGTADKGDVAGIHGVVLECKNEKAISLASYVEEARVEARNAHARWWAAVVKRRGIGDPGESYAVMPLAQLVELLQAAGVR